ncbi:pyridoxamine 5'-phosphate oxidase family protein [Lentzea sp. NEAU-D13]|uniref:Pyridoxamine 5'-phosphate oxidase family protein n=1 Tax=Lentzea alba TaxID=2714351 RepID=A0A7C9VSA5_9PSEU|nr:pyridoxamine 5'-phosphate oxidase family protein [Lentzea alba]NGY63214.1 pyridoxamine 5'-phosphate oxidase family protein [Lentzea alba]
MAFEGRVVLIEDDDAWSLLPQSGLARLLYTRSALPAVRVLPFVLCGRTMVLALDFGAVEHLTHVIGSVTAVEVDDPLSAWSVTITSEAHEATSVCDESFAHDPALSRWLDGDPKAYLRIEPTLVCGQQFVPACPGAGHSGS